MSVTRDGAIILEVAVVPRASRSRIVGQHDGRLKIQLDAPPVDGAANEALVELVADRLELKRSHVSIIRGQTSRKKALRVEGIDRVALERALAPE
ncbi:MAG: DUF167 domain-containing protein [Deltaproteobacteria bacterium]|nr:DUF167 domain-containing protein [Deltaproteobacteria bacterium]